MRVLGLAMLLVHLTAGGLANAQECPEICKPGQVYSDDQRICVPDDKKTS